VRNPRKQSADARMELFSPQRLPERGPGGSRQGGRGGGPLETNVLPPEPKSLIFLNNHPAGSVKSRPKKQTNPGPSVPTQTTNSVNHNPCRLQSPTANSFAPCGTRKANVAFGFERSG